LGGCGDAARSLLVHNSPDGQELTTERKLLLKMPTHHGLDSLHWAPADLAEKFVSYFENAYKEQWGFICDGKTHQREEALR
jgi:hypothetical protein